MFDVLISKASLESISWQVALAAILLSTLLSSFIAFTYRKTYTGISLSKNFLEAMILSSIVATTIMLAIGDSIGRGLGMMGALAIIRFRTNIKDTRDIVFLFAALGAGIACGVYALDVAMVGALFFCITAGVLFKTNWGDEESIDGMLRVQVNADFENEQELEKILKKYCVTHSMAVVREARQGEIKELTYHVSLKIGVDTTVWLDTIRKSGVSQVHFAARNNGGDWS